MLEGADCRTKTLPPRRRAFRAARRPRRRLAPHRHRDRGARLLLALPRRPPLDDGGAPGARRRRGLERAAGGLGGGAGSEGLALGLMVAGNDYRAPLLLAQEAMSVQGISGGRLELGLGAGWDAADYRQLGLPLDRPGARIDRLAEAVRIIKTYCVGEPFDFEGKHYRLEGVVPAVRGPAPRLMIGGGGPRVLALAAREADIVGINVPLGGADLRSSLAEGATATERVEAAIET